MITALYACCILGFAKNGVMPLHNWLPSAMVAPTPVSALLHAVAVVKVGVFSTVRVMLYVFGVDTMQALNLGLPTAYFVSITILVASIVALSKDNLKARLAYSTVSQLSYVILGVALLTPAGIEGGLVHIANHAFSKITLFFCAGAIYVATHKKNISEMSGLGRVMPFTFGAFAIASLSMIGAPPVAGFVSKWYLLNGAFDAGSVGIILVLLASTLLNAAYFAPVVFRAFFGQPSREDAEHHHREAHPAMVIPLTITAVISVVIGIYPGFFMSFVETIAKMKLAKLIQFLRDRLKAVIWVCCGVLALVVLLDAMPAVVDKEHAHTGPEHWPAFWAVFGFVGCVVIILLSKWYGHLGIMTREDYYEDGLMDVSEPRSQAASDGSAAFTRQNEVSGNALPPKGGARESRARARSEGRPPCLISGSIPR